MALSVKKAYTKPLVVIITLMMCLGFCELPAVAQQQKTLHKVLKVGIAGNPPFVGQDTTVADGIAVEIWSTIAQLQDWKYKPIRFSSVPEALKALQNKKIDVLVGPVSITAERAQMVDFSQPYYFSGLSIMSRKDDLSLLDRIKPFFSKKMATAVLIFLSILAIVGTLIWLVEREKSPEQFPREPARGIANGMWLAIVTMSTTGYGDRAPVTFWGRVIAGCWMVISIIFATTMVAGIASTLTLTGMSTSTISQASDMKGKKIASPSESVAADLLQEFRAIPVSTKTLEQSFNLLEAKKIQGIVFDRPELLYFASKHPGANISVSRAVYDPTGYGFAFPSGSPMIKPVNIRLLQLSESGRIEQIIKPWIGNN